MYIHDKLSSETEKNGRAYSFDDNIALYRLSFSYFATQQNRNIIVCEIYAKMFAYFFKDLKFMHQMFAYSFKEKAHIFEQKLYSLLCLLL